MRDEIMIRVPNSMCILGCVCLCFLDNVVCVHTHANILIERLQYIQRFCKIYNNNNNKLSSLTIEGVA